MSLPYRVPGLIEPIAQPSSNVCWATVFTMIKSWKDQSSYDIEAALATVGTQYVALYRANAALATGQFGPFLSAAGLRHLAPQNPTIDGWEQRLRQSGPIWVGTMNSIAPTAGLHSRLVRGMTGDGTATGTFFEIVDPDGGRTYQESVAIFVRKYEDAYTSSHDDQYIQIRFY